VLDAADVRHGQPVGLAEAEPAILPADELVGEAELQLRMRGQVGDLAEAVLLLGRGGDRERVAVVEAERVADPDALRRQGLAHLLEGGARLRLQDDLGDGAGVLRVDVDRP
jgi:hypothetical protein